MCCHARLRYRYVLFFNCRRPIVTHYQNPAKRAFHAVLQSGARSDIGIWGSLPTKNEDSPHHFCTFIGEALSTSSREEIFFHKPSSAHGAPCSMLFSGQIPRLHDGGRPYLNAVGPPCMQHGVGSTEIISLMNRTRTRDF